MLRLTAAWSRFAAPFSPTVAARPHGMRTLSTPLTIPRPGHTAHLHLLSVLNTESFRFQPGHVVRILDAGRGGGRLIAYLAQTLPQLHPMLTHLPRGTRRRNA